MLIQKWKPHFGHRRQSTLCSVQYTRVWFLFFRGGSAYSNRNGCVVVHEGVVKFSFHNRDCVKTFNRVFWTLTSIRTGQPMLDGESPQSRNFCTFFGRFILSSLWVSFHFYIIYPLLCLIILFMFCVPSAVCNNSIDMCPCHAAGAKIHVVLFKMRVFFR